MFLWIVVFVSLIITQYEREENVSLTIEFHDECE